MDITLNEIELFKSRVNPEGYDPVVAEDDTPVQSPLHVQQVIIIRMTRKTGEKKS